LPLSRIARQFGTRGFHRGLLKCSWPEGTVYFCNVRGEDVMAFADLENRNFTLAQFVRQECGIAVRQCLAVRFACDAKSDIDAIAAIVKQDFPTLVPEEIPAFLQPKESAQ
jgi:hypothetical protein